jgi:hypothetical protein
MMTELIMLVCTRSSSFFTEIEDVSAGQYRIAPMAKILVALKHIAYGCSQSAFLDYIQMSDEGTAQQTCLKVCHIDSSDKSRVCECFFRVIMWADARRVSLLHEAERSVQGMLGSLDCMHVYWKNHPIFNPLINSDWSAYMCIIYMWTVNRFNWHQKLCWWLKILDS